MFFPDLRISPHSLLFQHHVLGVAHALFANTAHAHRTRRALIEATGASEVCRMHLMLWGSASWHAEALLLVSVALLLGGHVCCFTSASFRVALLVHAALLLHYALFVHTALFVQALILAHATLFVHASLIVHTAPFVIPLVSLCLCLSLSLLLGLSLRNKRLFLSHIVLATQIALMQTIERTD
jgi:hypothetical protein